MNIAIKTTHQELTDAMRALVEKKLSGLEKYTRHSKTPALLTCEVEESIAAVRAGGRYRAEGNLSVDGQLYRAEALHEMLEGAVDRVRDELARELSRSRKKERGLMRRSGDALKRLLRFGR